MAELSHGVGVVSVWIVGVVEDGLIFAIVLDETVCVGDEHVQNDAVWVVRIGINQLSTMPTPLDIHVVVGRLGNTFAVDPGLIGLTPIAANVAIEMNIAAMVHKICIRGLQKDSEKTPE